MSKLYFQRTHFSGLCFVALVILAFFVIGCGGGSGGGNPQTPTVDFSISASATSMKLESGQSQNVTISVTGSNGFASSINISMSGMPAGVTASPSTFTLMPGNQQVVAISTSAAAQTGTASIIIQGTSGSLSHLAQLSLNIIGIVTEAHPPTRTRYLRTDSFYNPNDLSIAPPHFSAYDAAHKQFFVSNPYMNEIDVYDATQEIETAQIPVPMAWGIDVSPYNGSLYAGTFIGDIYQIDTSTLSIINHFPSASIGPNGFVATTTLVLSDGRLALHGAPGGILGVDGYGASAVWDPVTNSLDAGSYGTGFCFGYDEGGFAVSGDRMRVLVTVVYEGGAGEPICSYDPIAKVATFGTFPYASFVRQIIPTPDGARFFLTSNVDGVGVFDAKTVQLLGRIASSDPGGVINSPTLPNAAAGAVISLDGKTLYLVDQGSGAVESYDTTALVQTGWIPSFIVTDSQNTIVISAIDETGLIVGPTGHGTGFIDASQLEVNQPSMFDPGFASPNTGPEAGDTEFNDNSGGFLVAQISDGATLSNFYVGNQPGTGASLTEFPNSIYSALATTPPSDLAGAVDLAAVLSDGGVGIVPEGFSYGPTILEVIPNGATAEGGQTGSIFGYGFGSTISGIQVTIGGQNAPVTAIGGYPDYTPFPFPEEEVQFTIPAGTAGTTVNVTVTTPSGTATATGEFQYTAAVESYPVKASLQAGIYDSARDLYYFTDHAQIQVLSKSTGMWQLPITLPGVSSKTQLLAVSESPDGSKIAVSDFGGQAIYVLNPDNTKSATRYPMSLDNDGGSSMLAPDGLAVTNAGMVYFVSANIGGAVARALHKLNTSTGAINDLFYLEQGDKIYPASKDINDEFDRVILNSDGSRAYTNIAGTSYMIDASNDQVYLSSRASNNDGVTQDLAVSADGGTVDINGFMTDSMLNPETETAYIDWETWLPTAALGQKLNHDGSILFQPLTDGIDLVARNTGRLLYRIQIPVTPANVYDSLVIGKGQNTLAVISPTGVSFVDLSSLPIAAKYAQSFAKAAHSRAGSAAFMPNNSPIKHTASNRSMHLNSRPRLKRRLGESKLTALTQ